MLAGATLLLGSTVAFAQTPQRFQSGPARVALIELYTSEGCSSCPPAEAWLNDLRKAPDLWREFVPIALHVNYWDRLGWRDALASKAFTDREHAYAATWNASSVYTPCFVRNGAEWRPGSASPQRDTKTAAAGELTLTWDAKSRSCRIDYVAGPLRQSEKSLLDATVTLLGGGLISDVRKGENAGRTLHHEFVALQLVTVTLTRDPATQKWTGSATLPPRTDVKSERFALAGWIHARGELAAKQAARGWLE